ncbi:LOW QUALITY PROTEIN: complement factor B [Pholidichthys leucotaenia]
MHVKSLLWIQLFFSIQQVFLQEAENVYEYENGEPLNCSVTESIKGGYVTYSQGGLEGSVLTYHCGPGKYAFPVSKRLCDAYGEWSAIRLADGRPVSRATCKAIMCPGQLQLDHGNFWPREQWFHVGTTQSFSCQEGFTLSGSVQRNCTVSGEWTGAIPVCISHIGECDDPGIPPGAQRSGTQFLMGEKVAYRCQAGLNLLGSADRVCLENREWSGSAPRCQGPNTFAPSFVAAAMTGSLARCDDVLSPDLKKGDGTSFGRTIEVAEGSRMHIYILLDTSGSIKKEQFKISMNATINLIRKLNSYDVHMNFHVLSFASTAINIVDINDMYVSGDADLVLWYLMDFNYSAHGRKTGTNLYAALKTVEERIAIFKENRVSNHFNETQNIIIIQTDGYSNTGTNPLMALAKIRQLLGYNSISPDHTDERMLDVYVFGVGDQVKKDELNSLASNKRGEQHVFILKDFQTLGEVFNSIISDKSVTLCGIAQEDISENWEASGGKALTTPWHVTLRSGEWGPGKSCFGSIISQTWVLTAAHCFTSDGKTKIPTQLVIEHGEGTANFKNVIMHPIYNISALKHRNMSEFYDYDVALVETENILLSWKARPICLPCTVAASRALKDANSTCEKHRKELLKPQETRAFFMHKTKMFGGERKQTHIHTGNQRSVCVEKARKLLKEPTDVTLDEFVPDRFFCTGGTAGYQDAITCKGDSGGSLFLQKRKRYFQVGVVSWGIIDICATSNRSPVDARDFHIDLFKIIPWLKKHLSEEIKFLPEIN